MRSRKEYEELEVSTLAPYATKSSLTRGRKYPEPEHPIRTAFQRDRDRVIHSTAFRRLEYKTQVFVNHEGDYYRTRLTHTLEASQISRSIARALCLNEELTEAIALAHDLGHTPFGHSGEQALNRLMAEHGGFEHNLQSLRIVEVLEERYPDFPGLNLTWEVREAIAKHAPKAPAQTLEPYASGQAPSLEAAVVELADEIAYSAHDIDDGIASNLLDAQILERSDLWREHFDKVREANPGRPFEILRYQAIRGILNAQVTDLIQEVERRIETHRIASPEDARACPFPLVGFGPSMKQKNEQLKEVLLRFLYQHYRVRRMADKAQRFLTELFHAYVSAPDALPPQVHARIERDGAHRAVCDYIAGMTDRSALDEYRKLFDPYEKV